MKKKNMFCKRASELKSVEELSLSKRDMEFLEIIGKPIEEVIAGIRLDRITNYYSIFETIILDDSPIWNLSTRDDIPGSEEEMYDYVHECIDAIDCCLREAGYLRDDYDLPSYILEEYCRWRGPADTWYDGVDDFEQVYRSFNENYETYDFSEEKFTKVLKVLSDWLTINQYEMVKFDFLTHVRIGRYNNLCYSDEEQSLLKAAKENILLFFRDEIVEIVLS